jgi:hypothetical protein
MKRAVSRAFVSVFIACAVMAALPSGAQAPPGKDRGEYPVVLQAGEVFDLCRSGEIVCPARTPICDAPTVAIPVDLPDGLGFKGVSPGTTLCSAASAAGPRRVFRITVR